MTTARVVVMFNKWWELDPALAVLLSAYVRKTGSLDWPSLHDHPRPRRNPGKPGSPDKAKPRAVFKLPYATIEIWCISDLLEHLPDKSRWQSSSERKAERIHEAFEGPPVACCIAAGTAASGDAPSRNGSVVIGTKCFLYNAKPGGINPDSDWRTGPFDQIIDSELSPDRFSTLTALDPPESSLRLLSPPLAPAPTPTFLCDYSAVALGALNITDYHDYAVADRAALDAFAKGAPGAVFGSLETTHGLIRVLGPDQFLFVSGIVDRLLHFHDDVSPREYAQNTVGAHNVGVALAWMLPSLEQALQ